MQSRTRAAERFYHTTPAPGRRPAARSDSPSPCNLGETKASMDAMISLRTAPSETKACMHTFVSLRSHHHNQPQNEAPAFMDAPDRFGLGGH